MKYFVVKSPTGKELEFTRITSLRRYLKENESIQTVDRHWWSGQDLIDVETLTREDIFGKKAGELKSGMTAQWAHDHGRM